MIFDKICGVAERHLPMLIPILNKAYIFVFEGIAHKKLIGAYDDRDDEEIQDIYDNFFLPFSCVAIEDKASCIILIDTINEQTGLAGERLFLEALQMTTKNEQYFETTHSFRREEKGLLEEMEREGFISLIFGRVNCTEFKREKMGVNGCVDMYYMGNKDRLDNYSYLIKDNATIMAQHSLQNVIAAYHELIYFNRPNRFVLRESPAKKPKRKNGRVLRSNQRSIYTLLRPEQIRSKLGLSSGTRSSGREVDAHRRLRHRRYLSASIYKYDKNGNEITPKIIPRGHQREGQNYYRMIIVRDAWVGESEKVIGKKFYKVVYDR